MGVFPWVKVRRGLLQYVIKSQKLLETTTYRGEMWGTLPLSPLICFPPKLWKLVSFLTALLILTSTWEISKEIAWVFTNWPQKWPFLQGWCQMGLSASDTLWSSKFERVKRMDGMRPECWPGGWLSPLCFSPWTDSRSQENSLMTLGSRSSLHAAPKAGFVS